MTIYRTNGAIGALLDEYERALREFQNIIKDITPEQLLMVIDPDTKDPNCRSIQTILSHVVIAGNWYATEVRKHRGEQVDFPSNTAFDTIEEYQIELNAMFKNNEDLFRTYPNIELEEKDNSKKVKVAWDQLYSVEQLFEHAIVHILRHRRQIERILIKLNS